MTTLHTTVDSKSGDLKRVRDMVSALERAHALSAEVVFDLNVVLDELISNIIKYAYTDDAPHEIRVSLSAAGGVVEVGIEDDGKAFDPFAAPEPDLTLPLSERPIGGLGVHFVRKLMNEIKYKREDGRNILFLKKKL